MGSGAGNAEMLGIANGIKLPVGIAGWYRVSLQWIVVNTSTNNASYNMIITNNNTFFNLQLANISLVYRNGDSGFGAISGGGAYSLVFNSNSNTSDFLSLQIQNPSSTMVISNVIMTLEWIGGNL